MNQEFKYAEPNQEQYADDQGLDIQVLETRARHHESPELMAQIGLCHPFSMSIYGTTGSGKTVFAVNLLLDPRKYGGYFDEIHLFGLTAKSDDTWKHLNLKKEHIHDDMAKMIPDLKKLLEKQKREVESKGVLKCKKICLVFEDATTNIKLLNSPVYVQAYVQNRHNAVSAIAMCHKYRAQNRTCRLNSKHSIIYPADQTDVDQVVKETCPYGLSRDEYNDIIHYTFEPDDEHSHPFLWLNMTVDQSIRIRKTLKTIVRFS